MKETQQRSIGTALIRQRAARVPWTVLEKRYGMSQRRLYRLWRRASEGAGINCPNCGFHVVAR